MIGDLLNRRAGQNLSLRTKLGMVGALVLLAGLVVFAPTPFSGSPQVADGVRLLSITRTPQADVARVVVDRDEAVSLWTLGLDQRSTPLPGVDIDEGWVFVSVAGSCDGPEDIMAVEFTDGAVGIRFDDGCANPVGDAGLGSALFSLAVTLDLLEGVRTATTTS